jgi:hypothetical protein
LSAPGLRCSSLPLSISCHYKSRSICFLSAFGELSAELAVFSGIPSDASFLLFVAAARPKPSRGRLFAWLVGAARTDGIELSAQPG